MFRTFTLRPALALSAGVLVFLTSFPSWAQAPLPAVTLQELAQHVGSGATLTVTDAGGRKVTGELVELTPTHLTVRANGSERTFTPDILAEVRRRERDSFLNGALIGGAVGAIPLIIIASSNWCSDEGPNCGGADTTAMLYLAAGVGAGIGLDALIAKSTLVYRRRAVALALKPLVNHGRAGMGLSVRF